MHPDETISRTSPGKFYNTRSNYYQTFFFTFRPASFDLVTGGHMSFPVDQKEIGDCRCFRQLKIDPERQSEIDPPLLTQKPVEQINLTQLIVS